MRSLLTLTCLLFSSSNALAANLDFGPLQCREGTADSGPLLSKLIFDRAAKPFVCQLTATNNTGATLSGVKVGLTFGQHTAVPLPWNADTDQDQVADVNAGAYFHCLGGGAAPASETFTPPMVIGVIANYPGFNQNVVVQGGGITHPYIVRCGDFTDIPRVEWTIDNLGNGQQSAMRVVFYSGYSVQDVVPFETQMSVTVTGADATLPPSVPIRVEDTDDDTFFFSALAPQRMTPSLALAGNLRVASEGGTDDVANARTGTELDLYLPYLHHDGSEWVLRMDDAYDAGVDVLLFDPDDLQLNVNYRNANAAFGVHYRDRGEGTQEIAPTGALAIPLEEIAPNHYHLDWGYFPGDPGYLAVRAFSLSWAADFNRDPVVQDWLAARPYLASGDNAGSLAGFETGRVCVDSDQTDEVCAVATGTLYDTLARLEAALLLDTTWGLPTTVGLAEPSAPAPFTTMQSQFAIATLPWRGMEVFGSLQFPNGHVTTDESSDPVFAVPMGFLQGATALPTPMTFAAGTEADTSHEATLLQRVVPLSTTWSAITPGVITDPEVKELTWTCAPSRYAVRNFGGRECGIGLTWRVPGNARSSVTGENVQTPSDMTDASLGATLKYGATDGDTQVLTHALALDIEVNAQSRYGTSFVTDSGVDMGNPLTVGRVHQAPQATVTTSAHASTGCLWANMALGNIYGPISIALTWPEGFYPTSTDPDDPDGARALFGRETLTLAASLGVGARAPETSYAYDVDLPNRTLTVTFDGPLDGTDQRFPGPDEVDTDTLDYVEARWLAVRLRGIYLPGVAPLPEWGCTVTIGGITDSSGVIVTPDPIVRPPGVPQRVIGPSSLTLDGAPSSNPVTLGGTWTTTLNLHNAAYSTSGILTNGAKLQSEDTALFVRVPQAGDPGQSGTVATAFVAASLHASNPARIYVSSADTLPSPLPNSEQLATDPAFTLCAIENEPCLASAAPGTVRWVAFALDTVLVTDAAPRGTPPPPYGSGRVEAPYVATLTLEDVGSSDGARAVPYAVGTNAAGAPVDAFYPVDLLAPDLCAEPIYEICSEDAPGSVFTFDVVRAADGAVCAVRCTISGPEGALACDPTPVCPD